MDVTEGTLTPPVSTPGINLGQLDGLNIEIAEAEPSSAGTYEVERPTNAVPNLMSTLDREILGEGQLPPAELSSDRLDSQETIVSQSMELSGLGDITLALEKEAGLGDVASGSAQTPGETAEVKQVYDLDLDEDVDGLPLKGTVDEAHAGDEEEAAEYTLEIEEDLEFEIDRLEWEQDDEDEDENDDDR